MSDRAFDRIKEVVSTYTTDHLVDTIAKLSAQPRMVRGERMVLSAAITALRQRIPAVETAWTAAVKANEEPAAVRAAVLAAARS
ncbi:hypothetical protein [Nocardia wallacei]|uniref:Uncharacterized protein n=1 Tax=Nocardia wallacei TaxID=480035 RepID=A0A7G1KZ01_9NOCA|nr:hypothetical protein [Nocardia wallacei]BCK58394.1 hypothetical protein NWFMUON74_61660 [Nocardia wallacei]